MRNYIFIIAVLFGLIGCGKFLDKTVSQSKTDDSQKSNAIEPLKISKFDIQEHPVKITWEANINQNADYIIQACFENYIDCVTYYQIECLDKQNCIIKDDANREIQNRVELKKDLLTDKNIKRFIFIDNRFEYIFSDENNLLFKIRAYNQTANGNWELFSRVAP
ncbi:MAG: hypothetical protein HY843_02830 [Bdellovibrio sp.]|nr:hypothetical protein [Bdellovibrio sp.]